MDEILNEKEKILSEKVFEKIRDIIATDYLKDNLNSVSSYIQEINRVIEETITEELYVTEEIRFYDNFENLYSYVESCIPDIVADVIDSIGKSKDQWELARMSMVKCAMNQSIVKYTWSVKMPSMILVHMYVNCEEQFVEIHIDELEDGIDKMEDAIQCLTVAHIKDIIEEKAFELSIEKAFPLIDNYCKSVGYTWEKVQESRAAYITIRTGFSNDIYLNINSRDYVETMVTCFLEELEKKRQRIMPIWKRFKESDKYSGFNIRVNASGISDFELVLERKGEYQLTYPCTKGITFEEIDSKVTDVIALREKVCHYMISRLTDAGISWSVSVENKVFKMSLGSRIFSAESSNVMETLKTFIDKHIEKETFLAKIKRVLSSVLDPLNIMWGVPFIEDGEVIISVYQKGNTVKMFRFLSEDSNLLENIRETMQEYYCR